MPAIAIVDDREGDRETIAKVVRSTLKKLKEDSWNVVSDVPPARERDVLNWLDEHDATVLLTDWKLNEGGKDSRVVNYEADRLIGEIRSKRPTFPIFVVTGFESEARTFLKDVENILSRRDFAKNASVVVPQMVRAGRRRYEEQRELLGRMDVLARAVASGEATGKQRAALSSLQGFFQAELPGIISVDTVLDELEHARNDAENLRKKIERRMTKKKGKR